MIAGDCSGEINWYLGRLVIFSNILLACIFRYFGADSLFFIVIFQWNFIPFFMLKQIISKTLFERDPVLYFPWYSLKCFVNFLNIFAKFSPNLIKTSLATSAILTLSLWKFHCDHCALPFSARAHVRIGVGFCFGVPRGRASFSAWNFDQIETI